MDKRKASVGDLVLRAGIDAEGFGGPWPCRPALAFVTGTSSRGRWVREPDDDMSVLYTITYLAPNDRGLADEQVFARHFKVIARVTQEEPDGSTI